MFCREENPYEAGVIRQIAAWQTQRPALFNRLAGGASRPLSRFLGRLIPETSIRAAVSSAYECSTWLANPGWLKSAARGVSLDELRTASLELSDALADRIGGVTQVSAFVGGAVTGAGGLFSAPVDVGMLMMIALNGIRRVGHCYGYPLDQPEDRPYVLAILMLAGTQDLRARQELMGPLGDFKNWVLARSIESVAVDRLTGQFVRIAGMEAFPGLGAIVGAALNLAFMRQVLIDAKRVFQQRWLGDNRTTHQQSPARIRSIHPRTQLHPLQQSTAIPAHV
jgi:hypothetical protein